MSSDLATDELLAGLRAEGPRVAVAAPGGELSADALLGLGGALAGRLAGRSRVLLWATAELATIVGLVGALGAGAEVVPLSPKSGRRELGHIVGDAGATAILAGPDVELPAELSTLERVPVDLDAAPRPLPAVAADERAALVIYTSGTTGAPKGVVTSRRAIAANLDALATTWGWTPADTLVHALPLFHVHGLVLGVLGPLRIGGGVHHVGGFDVGRTCAALDAGGTMLFGVPTMYNRLAAAAEEDPAVVAALGRARLLVSGSAPLPAALHERLRARTGQAVVERYGMTETLIISSTSPGEGARAGYVGAPLPGVELRVVGEDGGEVPHDDATIGQVLVRGPGLMLGYLNQPEATAACFRDGWFRTGDVGVIAPDGWLRLVGRESVDLIKTGGFRIGAGEIEAALLTHPAVGEAAVVGVPDEDLGQRIVAWVVPAPDASVADAELIDYVAAELTPHKRPREVRFTGELPRNALGKVQKQRLAADG